MLWLAALVAAAFVSSSMGQGPPAGSPPGLDKAIAAKEKNAQRMLDKPGVAGIGVTLDKHGKPVIEIYKEKDDVPDLPDSLDGVAVQSVTTGVIEPRSLPTDRFPHPVPIGVSGGLSGVATGTLGARVTDGTNVYILSNNHVLAGVNTASIGDPIIQPGDADGGHDPDDRVATLAAYQTINFSGGTNTMDAAIALTSTANVGTATPADGYGAPSPVTAPAVYRPGSAEVRTHDRTPAGQRGRDERLGRRLLRRPRSTSASRRRGLPGSSPISPGPFSAPGDSGSLVVTQGGNQPVGLLFAGGDGLTIATPIDLVLQRFGVTVDGTPPGPGPPSGADALSALARRRERGHLVDAARLRRGLAGHELQGVPRHEPGRGVVPRKCGRRRRRFVETGLTNGTTYYYKVSAENANGEGQLSNEASATPTDLVPPVEPLPTVDAFNRTIENPLSDGGRWANGINSTTGVETGLFTSPRTRSLARRRRPAPPGASQPSTARTSRSGRRSRRFPARGTPSACTRACRSRDVGPTTATCCARTSSREPTRSSSSASTTVRSSVA